MLFGIVSSKGQIVIPAHLRETHGIRAGTRVVFEDAGGRIVLRPVTPNLISSFRGSIGRKGAAQALLEERKLEREREDKRS